VIRLSQKKLRLLNETKPLPNGRITACKPVETITTKELKLDDQLDRILIEGVSLESKETECKTLYRTDLLTKIESQRSKMEELAKDLSLSDKKVVEASQVLDRYLNFYYRWFNDKKVQGINLKIS
jgi:hypothetical protein